MKKVMAVLICALSFNSIASANVITFQDQGTTTYLSGIILDELHTLKDQASEYLTNEHGCTHVKMHLIVKHKAWYSLQNIYTINGSANCPSLIAGALKVKIDAGAGSVMSLSVKDQNQKISIKKFITSGSGE